MLRSEFVGMGVLFLQKSSYAMHTVFIPSSWGILVYRLVTSIETRIVFCWTFVLSIKLMKSVVSLRYDIFMSIFEVRYIDDVSSLWDNDKKDVDRFIEQANKFHPTIKFTAEISENEITFLDTTVFKGERLKKDSILDIKTHFEPTETFQFTHFASCHPPGVKYGFIKGEAIRLLRTNSSKKTFEESLVKFKQRLQARRYPQNIIERSLSEVNFASRQSALTQKKKKSREDFAFCHHIPTGC